MAASNVVPEPRPGAGRSVGLAVGVGVLVALAVIGVLYALLVIPFYALAQIEPGSGLDRPVVRDGIVNFALPLGLVLGLLCGGVVGWWYAKGGRLPEE